MIVGMKRARVFVLKEYEEQLKRSLQRYGVLMITNDPNTTQVIDTQYEDNLINRTNRIIKELDKYKEKQKLFSPRFAIVDYERFSDVRSEQIELLETTEKMLSEVSKLKEKNEELLEENEKLVPFEELDVTTKDIESLTYANIFLGQVLTANLETFEAYLTTNNLSYETYGSDANGVAYAIVSKDNILSDLEAVGFVKVNLPILPHLIKDEIETNKLVVNSNELEILKLEEGLKEIAKSLDEIKLLSDQMLSERELKKYQASETEETVYFEGWVRVDQVNKLEKAVKHVTSDYEIDLRDPHPQELPPTSHKNNKFVAPFKTITDMFSVPNYREIDPNPVMSIFYWMFFGMMMGDWGYGIVMAIMFGLFLLLKKPKGDFGKLVKVLFLASFPSILFGILYGSVFGISFDIGKALFGVNFQVFDPMNKPIPMLIAALGVGVVHIFVALIIKAIRLGKERDFLGILAESVSWMLLIPGLVVMIALPKYSLYGIIAAATGGGLILLFSGRNKKGIFGKITGGLGGLYGITGYLSDILSYSRILALALSSGVIAYSMNIIGMMVIGPWYGYILGIIVFIIGHVFNLAMGLLSAYVHDSRLQYIEFFGKFYDGGGYAFKPLQLQYNYIYKVEDKDL